MIRKVKSMNANEKNATTTEHQDYSKIFSGHAQLPKYDPSDTSFNALISRALMYFHPATCQTVIPTPTADDQKTAFITGYLLAFHKARVYNPVLVTDQFGGIEHKIYNDLKSRRYINDVYEAYHYFITINNGVRIDFDSSESELKAFLITSYRAAFHVAGKYDDSLFLYESELEACIMADIIRLHDSHNNARRAQARIIVKSYGIKDAT